MKSSNIAVILPSRGLAFSQTMEEMLTNLKGYKYRIYFANGLPIPDCFNKPLDKALSNPKHTHLWFVEDDMVLPPDTLSRLLDAHYPAVAFDYPVTSKGVGAVQYDGTGKALFSGTGCLLVTRALLHKFKRPIFRDDVRWDIHVHPEGVELSKRYSKTETYGMHDVSFGLECYRRGTPIHILPGKVGQRKLKAWGEQNTNNGQHQIDIWDKVTSEPNFIKLSDALPSPLIAVKLKDGTVTNVSEDTATRLEKASQGKRIKYGAVSFT